ncbi:MAG TPA: TA system VapC family ribonuclease toxin [Gemmataceae bacterium]|nr:TA system VapC family ribonuclease toxin [Gemmataceae bacterium]
MLLPDVNVWVALTFDKHPNHMSAKSWFDALTDQVCHFCRLTQQGFLRISTNQKAMGLNALTLDAAWAAYDAFLGDVRVAFAAEPAGLETHWRAFTKGATFSTHVWNDAYLAAFAATAGLEVVTFDRGFAKFTTVRTTILP